MRVYLVVYGVMFLCLNLALARPKFSTVEIKLSSTKLKVEVADNNEKLSYGLMYKKKLEVNQGMLFIFIEERTLSFWMKNTFIDLSIGFFSKEKKLVEIVDMYAAKSELQSKFPTIESTKPAQYALEMSLGWFKKNNIKVGDKLEIFR